MRKEENLYVRFTPMKFFLFFSVLLLSIVIASHANAITVNVIGVNKDGTQSSVTSYRWLIEEDATKASIPGAPAVAGQNLSVSFHTSYMPVVAAGDETILPPALDPAKRYYISVLPKTSGSYTIGGASFKGSDASVDIYVNKLPLPTAQISVFVFEDNQPINNAPDLPAEHGLEGFQLTLIDAGGTYGISGGPVSQDAFGNPLGTTYLQTCDEFGQNPGSGNYGCYDANGNPIVLQMGNNIIKTGACPTPDAVGCGVALIENLAPGKYSILVTPPPGQGWHQTATIEGTKVIDAWVKPNEPPFFVEFGPPGYHVFIGFVKAMNNTAVLKGGATISGQVVNLHNSRPPDYTFYDGEPVSGAWVGLNTLAGAGIGVYAQPCDPNTGAFSIPNVPPSNYQLVVWDENLDLIFALLGVTVNPDLSCNTPNGSCNLLNVPVFNWFAKTDMMVFDDKNQNGFRDPDEGGIPQVPVNLRFRDGSIYQSQPTDNSGVAEFTEIFPFFNWFIAEVDFARLKATGATIVVDGGGPVNSDQGWTYPSRDKLTPQPQYCALSDVASDYLGCAALGVGAPIINPNTGNNLSKTEIGPVLLEAYQVFLGQTNIIEWGKAAYDPGIGENGGITGIIQYATTRAENDPKNAVAETWEPGIPRVQVNLYLDCNSDGIIDIPDLTNPNAHVCLRTRTGATAGDAPILADVDNYPFGWSTGGTKGPEDIDMNGDSIFDTGDAFRIAWADSWDDNVPTGCQGDIFYVHPAIDPNTGLPIPGTGQPTDCFDGLRNFNQVRPGVFDGGFAFGSPAGDVIPNGTYIVEAVTPPGYIDVKEEDKNVDFGDDYIPSPLLVPPPCVGTFENTGIHHIVPLYLTLFTDQMIPAYRAGLETPLCNMKQVTVSSGSNAASNFFMFTEVPVAGHITGFILDDTSNEFDPTAPNFGEKYAPPWMPVSVRDWTGREISRVYSDEYGTYNALVPSTYSTNIPMPSGVSPNMVTVCLNNPGPIFQNGNWITDPLFNKQYSQFCYTFQYMPGKTTYLDTPVVPVAAFAGPGQFPLDCEYPDGTPRIHSVNGVNGPYVSVAGQTITITSMGQVEVLNPLYDGPGGVQPKTIFRDYGFGATTGTVTINGVPLQSVAWAVDGSSISGVVATGTTTGELVVTRGDNGKSTITGVTVTVGGAAPITVAKAGAMYSTIQAAIDAAPAGSLITVAPGNYEELVVMWKPVRLQGWGEGSTTINAVKSPAEKLQLWREKVNNLYLAGAFDVLPGQPVGLGFPEPPLFGTEEGPGVIVLSKNTSVALGGYGLVNGLPNARIDGFIITGADHGGAIFVNGYAHYTEISNNNITGNQGFYGGGIRLGHPILTDGVPLDYVNAMSDHITIHNNHISQNGGLGEAGGGISIHTGSDNYRVEQNFICGNFTMGDGGGIGHQGLSNNGMINRNTITFNQSFNQGTGVQGGGILIAGGAPLAVGGLTPGSGTVTINRNLILGNLSGAGDGGGIRTQFVNGQDVLDRPNSVNNWYAVNIFNNMVVNNVAGLAGGAISMQDTARINIINNTIADNDSTATAGLAFTPGNPNQSNPQPAGIVSRAHTSALTNAIGNSSLVLSLKFFSNPDLRNNIIWHNRSFYFSADFTTDPPTYKLFPDIGAGQPPVYNDLAVLGTAIPRRLNPLFCILTDTTGYAASNISADPMFVASYFNGASNMIQQPEVTTSIQQAPAFDEGGNFIDVRFGPLTLINPATGLPFGNYHITMGSPAIDRGANGAVSVMPATLRFDYDGDPRILDGNGDTILTVDMGADEYMP